MDRNMDLIVIGAGPAGLSAACAARACGLDVTLIDEQAAPGGQLFRNIETPMAQALLDPKERAAGLELVKRFRESGATYYPGTIVWGLEPHRVSCTMNGKAEELTASHIIVAPGGMERPVPFPGWTLPGVMGAGGADILLRSGGTLSADKNAPVVLAGNGPLLLLLAGHLLEAGVPIAAWLDTGWWSRRIMAAGLMPAGVLDMPYVAKGMKMALRVLKGKVPIIRNVTNIRAVGSDHLEKVVYDAGGKTHEINASTLLRHEGIIPRTHILNSLNARHAWDGVQRYWHPVVDENGRTSVDGISIAGDGTYVHGGDAEYAQGHHRRSSDRPAPWRDQRSRSSLPQRPVPQAAPCHAHRARVPALCVRTQSGHLQCPGRNAGLPLRMRHRRGYPQGRGRRLPRRQRSQALHPLRHGPVPGPYVRARARGNHRRRPVQGARRRGLPPSPPALPAGQP